MFPPSPIILQQLAQVSPLSQGLGGIFITASLTQMISLCPPGGTVSTSKLKGDIYVSVAFL